MLEHFHWSTPVAMEETEQILAEGTPPQPAGMGAVRLETLEGWWEDRWKQYVENRFSVIMPLWLRTRDQPVGMHQMKVQYQQVYAKQVARNNDGIAPNDGLGLHVNAVIEMLGEGISDEACAKLLAEMDQHRAGAVDGLVDRNEAATWWSQYTDDESLLEQAWDAEGVKHDTFGNLDAENLARVVQLLLRPTVKEARLAVWAACGDCFGKDGSPTQSVSLSRSQSFLTHLGSSVCDTPSEADNTVNEVAAWLMHRGKGNTRDKERIKAFLGDTAAVSSIFAEDADGPSDKDKDLVEELISRETSEQQDQLADLQPDEADVRRRHSAFDHFFDQWMRMHRCATDANFVAEGSEGKAVHPKQRLLDAWRACGRRPSFDAVIEALLEPTAEGMENMRRQIDLNNDGRVDKTEVLTWWKRNCSPDIRAFERAWMAADKDCDDELSTEELKTLLGFESTAHLYDKHDEPSESAGGSSPKHLRPAGNAIGLKGLKAGDYSMLVQSLDDNYQPDAVQNILAERPPSIAVDGSEHRFSYTFRVNITQGSRLQGLDRGGTSDPYVVCQMKYSEEAEKAFAEADEEAARRDAEADRQEEAERRAQAALADASLSHAAEAIPEPEPEPKPTAATAAAGAPAKYYCQFRGEGEFVPVWLTLSDVDDNGVRVLEVRQDSPERTLLREADVSGCKVMKPRFGRNVSQLEAGKTSYARRIDLARRDSEGDLKYIIATDCCETLDAWIGAFAEPTESHELTDEERKQLKKLYTELTSIRKLGAISYDAGNLVEAAEAYSQAVDLLSSAGTCHLSKPKTVEEEEEEEEAAQHRGREASKGSQPGTSESTGYLLEFTTADVTGAGTDAKVFVTLFGKNEAGTDITTGERQVPWTSEQFETGSVDTILLENMTDVGELTKLTVRQDDTGFGAAWLLDRVVVRSTTNGQKAWTFPCKKWLQSSFGSQDQLSVDLLPTSGGRKLSLPLPTVDTPGLVTRSDLLCARARCWKKLALRDDKSTDEMVQLWTNVRDDAAAATEGLQQKDTAEADQLFAEADIKLRELTTGSNKRAEKEGKVYCQYDGKGEFKDVQLSLRNSSFAAAVGQSKQTEITYELEFTTGNLSGAGTDAQVFVTLFGRDDAGKVTTTGKTAVPWTREQFEAGQVDQVLLKNVTCVGQLTKLTIEHDGKGFGAGWFLESVDVKPASSSTGGSWKAHFPCHKWLHEDERYGQLRQDLFPESPGALVFKEVQSSAHWTVELHETAKVSEPHTVRDGFPFALRLDMGGRDAMGHRKYIIASDSAEQIAAWRAALGSYCSLQAKAVQNSGHKVLQMAIEKMKPQQTHRINKTNDAYWDETFSFEWSCTRRELNFLELNVKCMDWNTVGRDKLIGTAPPINIMEVFDSIGTPQCYSQPFTTKLLFGEHEAETQRGDITMYAVLEEHLSKPVRATLYPTYMNEEFLTRHVQAPKVLTQSGSFPEYALDVCLLGLRALKDELRQPSVEIIVNGDDKPSVVDRSFTGQGKTKISRYRAANQSKRLYTVGKGLNPSLADYEGVAQELLTLSPAEVKRRAILAGVRPPTVDNAIFRQGFSGEDGEHLLRAETQKVRGWVATTEELLTGYKDVRFSHPTDPNWYPKSLTIRIWHKPWGRTGMFAKHQPAELYAQACIPLIQRKVSSSTALEDKSAKKAIELYQEGMRLLHVQHDHLSHKQTPLHPSGKTIEEIKSELDADHDDNRPGPLSKHHEVQQNSQSAIKLFDQAVEEASNIEDADIKNRVLTKLHSGHREATLHRKFGHTTEAWLRGREVLQGTWESSGSVASRAPVFGSWELFDESSRSSGTVRCAFRLGEASQFNDSSHQANTDWKRVKQMTADKHVVVRVYVVRGRNLRAMDRNNTSDPYVTCTLTGSGTTKGTTERQMLGGSEQRMNQTLNPEFRQVFEFKPILMPGCAKLKLCVKDWDAISLDDDIGHTEIDLEHRYLCKQWKALEEKPLETRELARKSSKRSTYGNGSLQLWIDIIPVSPTHPLPPVVDISLPDPERFQLRVIVWNAEGMKDDDDVLDDGGGQHMNDLYFSGHLRTKLGGKVVEQSKSKTQQVIFR